MRELNKELYRKLYLVRRAEEKICIHYPEDDMKTPMHMSFGEEAVVVGVCHALGEAGQVFGTYRSHAAFIAKTEDTDEFFAELYAKDTSSLKGKGGSMHLCSPRHGFMGTSAIVASHISVAAGAAFANKRQKNGKIVAAFFGDGAVDEGVFWESLNAACLMKLPVVFVCEDNGFAVHTPAAARRGYASLPRVLSTFDCHVFESDSTDVEVIHALASDALERMRKEEKPCFMNLKYYRYLEHVGINYDFEAGYRPRDEFERWHEKDPVRVQRAKLLTLGVGAEELLRIEAEVDTKISRSVALAQQAPLSQCSEAYNGVFKCDG
ncbi:MAG: thiamine pyrophosphate-dependent dehydrogenase E1 component subunit alpha [Thermodesulfovibrionales bacterium]